MKLKRAWTFFGWDRGYSTADERARVGIPDGLVRLSAGIESAEDILSDLEGGAKDGEVK